MGNKKSVSFFVRKVDLLRRFRLVILLLATLLVSTDLWAGSVPELKETTQPEVAQQGSNVESDVFPAEFIQALERIDVDEYVPSSSCSDSEFYLRLLNDLKNQKNVKYVLPLVDTDDYFDPALQKALGVCTAQKLNIKMKHGWEEMKGELEKGDNAKILYPYAQYSHWGYRFWTLNLDGNRENGLEHIFYLGGFFNKGDEPDEKVYRRGLIQNDWLYILRDNETCDYLTEYQILNCPIDVFSRKKINNYTEIIKYEDSYYLVQFFRGVYVINHYIQQYCDGTNGCNLYYDHVTFDKLSFNNDLRQHGCSLRRVPRLNLGTRNYKQQNDNE